MIDHAVLQARSNLFRQSLAGRILFLDGAMGTMIQGYQLTEQDYRGPRFADWGSDLKGNNDLLCLTQPQIIRAIHDAYLDAGADILETCSFNSTRVSMADYGMEELVYELNVASARIARAACEAMTAKTPDRPRFVAGVLGPTSRTCSRAAQYGSTTRDGHLRNLPVQWSKTRPDNHLAGPSTGFIVCRESDSNISLRRGAEDETIRWNGLALQQLCNRLVG